MRALATLLVLAFVTSGAVTGQETPPAGPGSTSWTGAYRSDKLRMTLDLREGRLVGAITMGDRAFPCQADERGGRLEGVFSVDGSSFTFTATMAGRVLTLTTDGAVHVLEKESPNPLSGSEPAVPGSSPTAPPWPTGEEARLQVESTGPRRVRPPTWQASSHVDPLGFSLQHPSGWRVQTPGELSIVVRDPDTGSFALAHPFVARRGATAEEWLKTAVAEFDELLPRATVVKVVPGSGDPDEARAIVEFPGPGGTFRAHLLGSIHRRSGMLLAVAASKERFDASRPMLVEILASLTFKAPMRKVQPPAESPDYTWWEDPRERAFKAQVPRGWTVEGGLFRRTAQDPRGCLIMTAPDGGIRIQSGDITIPVFALPGFSPLFPEGSDYSPGYGLLLRVKGRRTGAQCAREYVVSSVRRFCDGLTITGESDRDDVVALSNRIRAQFNVSLVNQQLSAGEVAFTCGENGQRRGFWFAATESTITNAGHGKPAGIWSVPSLLGYVARADQEAQAQAVLVAFVRSLVISPEWCALQQGMNARVATMVNTTNQQLAAILLKGREVRPGEDVRKWTSAALGESAVRDPDTGETWRMVSGHNYYWALEGGAAARPDVNVRLLDTLE